MEKRRFILYAAMVLILFSLWNQWRTEYPDSLPQFIKAAVPSASRGEQNNQLNSESNALLPDLDQQKTAEPITGQKTISQSTENSHSVIHVKTDVFAVDIDTTNGDIVHVELLDYPVSVNEKNNPIVLLTEDKAHRYTANSSLLINSPSGAKNINFDFHSDANQYEFNDDQQTLNVVLTGSSEQGLQVKKVFSFKRGSYLIDVNYDINNETSSPWQGFLNMQLFRTAPDEDKSSLFHIGSYTGASYSNPESQRYKKVNFSDMNKENLNQLVKSGWVAMQQHYFLSAWVPSPETTNTFYTRAAGGTYTIGLVSQPIVINVGQNKSIDAQLYVGPEITNELKVISPGLDLTIDYGWLWFLSSFPFTIMSAIYHVVGNWGWSIVFVTVLVKLVFYRLSASSYRSMAGMRKLQPKLQALRERCGDDKAKLSQATMELYRQEKINPLGGCLPVIVQIPVFIALYWVLLESVELRQAPFIFWIQDLSAADPFHVLPIIMGLTMLIQQRLNPAPPDPMQARIMMCLPIIFTGLFWNFPAGLVLYWIINNSLSILQQWYITRKYS